MIYFDTDVWIHSLVQQSEEKHTQANDLLRACHQEGYVISNVNLQEILFVLDKLKVPSSEIEEIAEQLFKLNRVDSTHQETLRAFTLAKSIGFRHINDCLHTAIAETHCTELVTYNKKDFDRIKALTHLKVSIL